MATLAETRGKLQTTDSLVERETEINNRPDNRGLRAEQVRRALPSSPVE